MRDGRHFFLLAPGRVGRQLERTMPSGKQVLLALMSRFSQRQHDAGELDDVSARFIAGLLLHGSTADDTWIALDRIGWIEGETEWRGFRQGPGLREGQVFLADLFEVMTESEEIPESVKRAFPSLRQEEYSSAILVMWLMLSACQFHKGLECVENGGKLDPAEESRMVESMVKKLKLFREDPWDFLGRTPPPD